MRIRLQIFTIIAVYFVKSAPAITLGRSDDPLVASLDLPDEDGDATAFAISGKHTAAAGALSTDGAAVAAAGQGNAVAAAAGDGEIVTAVASSLLDENNEADSDSGDRSNGSDTKE